MISARQIRLIVANELRSAFVSPIAWLVLVVFAAHTALSFTAQIKRSAEYLFAYDYIGSLTGQIFFRGTSSVFQVTVQSLIVYVPLLTMAVIARERATGSIRLLQSSPISATEIVVGKFIAVATLITLMMSFLVLAAISGTIFVENFGLAATLMGVFGLWLLALTYAAVGVFMSSTTQHQIVAALMTSALLYGLSLLWAFGQSVPYLADVAYWLSISGRVSQFLSGLFTLDDVIYFMLMSALFLAITVLRMNAVQSRGPFQKLLKYSVLISLVVALAAASQTPGWSISHDFSATKRNSLVPGELEVVERLEGKWKVTVYANVLDTDAYRFMPQYHRLLKRSLFAQHMRVQPHLELEYKYFYYAPDGSDARQANPGLTEAELAEKFAREQGLRFGEMVHASELAEIYGTTPDRSFFVLNAHDSQEIMRTYPDSAYFPRRRSTATAFKRAIDGGLSLGVIQASGERSISVAGAEGLRAVFSDTERRRSLGNNGFDIEDIALEDLESREFDVLFVPTPSRAYTIEELESLTNYLASGRHMLIAGEPSTSRFLKPLLDQVGLSLSEESIEGADREGLSKTTIIGDYVQGVELKDWRIDGLDDGVVAFEDAGELTPSSNDSEFTLTPLVVAEACSGSDNNCSVTSPAWLIVAGTRVLNGVEQRVVISSDVDVLASGFQLILVTDSQTNYALYERLFEFLTLGEYPLNLDRLRADDTGLRIDISDAELLRWMYVAGIPCMLTLIGGVFLWQRRRRATRHGCLEDASVPRPVQP